MAYGTPADPVGGTVATVAYMVANVLDPIRALRTFTGGSDPPGSGYVVESTSTSATTWRLVNAAKIASWLGYTPANKAGDTFTGAVVIGGNFQVGGTSTMGNVNAAAVSGSAGTFTSTLSALSAAFTNAVTAASATLTGALSAASATISGALSAASATISGTLSAASAAISGNATVGGTLGVTGTTTGTTINGTTDVQKGGTSVVNRAIHTGTQLASTISDFATAALTATAAAYAAATHTHGNMARTATSTYTGNGAGTQVVNVGFTPTWVCIQKETTSNAMGFLMTHDMAIILPPGPGFNAGSSLTLNSFTVSLASGMNASGERYRFVAIG